MAYEIKEEKIDELIKILVCPWELKEQHEFNKTITKFRVQPETLGEKPFISDVEMCDFFDESKLSEEENEFLHRHRT